MNNITSLIVEDDADAVLLLQHFIAKLPFFSKPDVAATGMQALDLIHSKDYKLIFLDMLLPDINGKDVMASFPKRPPVIITTVSPDFAVDCFDMEVADYLVKPFGFPRFLKAANRALGGVKILSNSISNEAIIYLKVGRKVQGFLYKDIDYAEGYGIYTKVHSNGQVTIVNESIKTLEDRLPRKYFARIHKSYLIHVGKITAFDYRQIELGKVVLPIGMSYKPQLSGLMELLNKK